MNINQPIRNLGKFNDSGRYIRVEIKLPSGAQETISIFLARTVTLIDDKMFTDYDIKNITSVVLPEGIETVDKYTFMKFLSLTSMVLPESVKTVGPFAFGGCINLVSVTLSVSIRRIGFAAFAGCDVLEVIHIKTHDEKLFSWIKKLLPENLRELAKPPSKMKSARSVISCDEAQSEPTQVSVVAQSGLFAKKSDDEPNEKAVVTLSYPKN